MRYETLNRLAKWAARAFTPECFGGVMAAEQKVNSELFGGDSGPMRRFACNEGVNLFFRDAVNFRAAPLLRYQWHVSSSGRS